MTTHRLCRTLGSVVIAVAALAPSGCGTSAPSTRAADTVSPSSLLVHVDDLPTGWRSSSSPGTDYRVTVCGVDLEPQAPEAVTSVRFAQSALGPFLEEHVRVYDSGRTIEDVAEELRAALRSCSSYAARGSDPASPTAHFSVEPLTVAGAPEDSVAWRQRPDGTVPITSDLLLVPHGDAAVLLMSYAIRDTPDPAVLARAAAALPAVQ
ncbi:hypothetical protein [Nocardioides sp. Kera G14]|uniref:hypothetical protein n=1 Tax=Nocardioides sp. Kera G14 TaxID=2884264 RepID=UPI001D100B27|nr:hypothetical protein [Nocardioides sp. Kera G14]UDY23370.1 hypothetical protein LH076_15100 [Nocardioides sp. Kera G14]